MKEKKSTCSTQKEPYEDIVNEEPYICVKCGKGISFFDLVDFEIKGNKIKPESVYCFECQIDRLKK